MRFWVSRSRAPAMFSEWMFPVGVKRTLVPVGWPLLSMTMSSYGNSGRSA